MDDTSGSDYDSEGERGQSHGTTHASRGGCESPPPRSSPTLPGHNPPSGFPSPPSALTLPTIADSASESDSDDSARVNRLGAATPHAGDEWENHISDGELNGNDPDHGGEDATSPSPAPMLPQRTHDDADNADDVSNYNDDDDDDDYSDNDEGDNGDGEDDYEASSDDGNKHNVSKTLKRHQYRGGSTNSRPVSDPPTQYLVETCVSLEALHARDLLGPHEFLRSPQGIPDESGGGGASGAARNVNDSHTGNGIQTASTYGVQSAVGVEADDNVSVSVPSSTGPTCDLRSTFWSDAASKLASYQLRAAQRLLKWMNECPQEAIEGPHLLFPQVQLVKMCTGAGKSWVALLAALLHLFAMTPNESSTSQHSIPRPPHCDTPSDGTLKSNGAGHASPNVCKDNSRSHIPAASSPFPPLEDDTSSSGIVSKELTSGKLPRHSPPPPSPHPSASVWANGRWVPRRKVLIMSTRADVVRDLHQQLTHSDSPFNSLLGVPPDIVSFLSTRTLLLVRKTCTREQLDAAVVLLATSDFVRQGDVLSLLDPNDISLVVSDEADERQLGKQHQLMLSRFNWSLWLLTTATDTKTARGSGSVPGGPQTSLTGPRPSSTRGGKKRIGSKAPESDDYFSRLEGTFEIPDNGLLAHVTFAEAEAAGRVCCESMVWVHLAFGGRLDCALPFAQRRDIRLDGALVKPYLDEAFRLVSERLEESVGASGDFLGVLVTVPNRSSSKPEQLASWLTMLSAFAQHFGWAYVHISGQDDIQTAREKLAHSHVLISSQKAVSRGVNIAQLKFIIFWRLSPFDELVQALGRARRRYKHYNMLSLHLGLNPEHVQRLALFAAMEYGGGATHSLPAKKAVARYLSSATHLLPSSCVAEVLAAGPLWLAKLNSALAPLTPFVLNFQRAGVQSRVVCHELSIQQTGLRLTVVFLDGQVKRLNPRALYRAITSRNHGTWWKDLLIYPRAPDNPDWVPLERVLSREFRRCLQNLLTHAGYGPKGGRAGARKNPRRAQGEGVDYGQVTDNTGVDSELKGSGGEADLEAMCDWLEDLEDEDLPRQVDPRLIHVAEGQESSSEKGLLLGGSSSSSTAAASSASVLASSSPSRLQAIDDSLLEGNNFGAAADAMEQAVWASAVPRYSLAAFYYHDGHDHWQPKRLAVVEAKELDDKAHPTGSLASVLFTRCDAGEGMQVMDVQGGRGDEAVERFEARTTLSTAVRTDDENREQEKDEVVDVKSGVADGAGGGRTRSNGRPTLDVGQLGKRAQGKNRSAEARGDDEGNDDDVGRDDDDVQVIAQVFKRRSRHTNLRSWVGDKCSEDDDDDTPGPVSMGLGACDSLGMDTDDDDDEDTEGACGINVGRLLSSRHGDRFRSRQRRQGAGRSSPTQTKTTEISRGNKDKNHNSQATHPVTSMNDNQTPNQHQNANDDTNNSDRDRKHGNRPRPSSDDAVAKRRRTSHKSLPIPVNPAPRTPSHMRLQAVTSSDNHPPTPPTPSIAPERGRTEQELIKRTKAKAALARRVCTVFTALQMTQPHKLQKTEFKLVAKAVTHHFVQLGWLENMLTKGQIPSDRTLRKAIELHLSRPGA